jgi:cell division septum initiation protein DivIVA
MGLSAGLVLGVLTSGILEGNGFFDETRRTVKEKARQILQDTRQKAGHVLDAAREAARSEAERQHLMPH